MNKILAILTLDMENIPSNFQEILKHENAVVEEWKAEGILENLYLRNEKNGAILIFNDMNEEKAIELMKRLPLFALRKSIEYFALKKQF